MQYDRLHVLACIRLASSTHAPATRSIWSHPALPCPALCPALFPALCPALSDVRHALPCVMQVAQHVKAKELSRPSLEQRGYRDASGTYGADAPFWSKVAGAR